MSTVEFTLTLNEFQGPLGLLLDLVERHKLEVNDISLVHVADEYIHYIENRENIPLSETTSFVLVASTLLLIKSKSLLPVQFTTPEEDNDITELEQRLQLYAYIRSLQKALRDLWGKQMFLSTISRKPQEISFRPTKDITTETLDATLQNVLNEIPTLVTTPTAHVQQEINLEDMISALEEKIRKVFQSSFKEVTSQATKVEYIVSFLALLELVRRGAIETSQHKTFADIQIKTDAITTPQYG